MKIGIYGGTFSPIHNGHILAAREFARQMRLDKLLIIPTATPPHKNEDCHINAEHRLKMCSIAFSDEDKITVSDIEVRRGGKSYTVHTLEELRECYPSDELFLLCGTDMILTFDRWYRFEDIFSMCCVVYERRENDRSLDEKIDEKIAFFEEQYGAEIRHIDISPIEISSTQIRERVSRGDNVSEYIPEKVAQYIEEQGLYRYRE